MTVDLVVSFDTVKIKRPSSLSTLAASLIAFLEHHRQNGDCYYGAHIADEAIITCLIFQRVGKHLHFIDGGNGGYTLASQKLKEMRATQH